MLQKLNEHLQGVVSWVIVILITITFAIFGLDYFLANRHNAAAVAVSVNNQEISKRDYEINLRRILQMKERDGVLSGRDETILKQQILDNMISNAVTVQAALKTGFLVSNEQANAAILSIPQFQENGHFSSNRYSQVLSNAFYTHESFQEEVRKGMLLNQQRFALVGTEFALADELTQFVHLYMQKRDYRYLVIPVADFKDKVSVSDKDIEQYYFTHENKYYYPERISLQYVIVSAEAIRKQINIPEDKLISHYEENKSSYLSPAKWKVAKIVLSNKSKEDAFIKEEATKIANYLQQNPDKFAEKYTEITGNNPNNKGMIVDVVAGDTDFDKQLLELSKANPVSNPILNNGRYVIFKLIAYSPAVTKSFKEVRDSINEQLIIEAVQSKYAETLEKLADLSYQTPDSLDMVSKTLDLPIMQTDLFDKHGGNTELTKNVTLLKTAFSHDVLELGNNSEPIQIDNDRVVVIRINKRIASSKIPLAELKQEIRKLISTNMAKDLAKQYGEGLMAKQNKSVDLMPIDLAGKQIQWIAVNDAARDNAQDNYFINELAFSILKTRQLAGKLFSDKHYIIVSLDKIKDGDVANLDKEQIASISQQLETSYGLRDYNFYINGLVNQAKIIKNQDS